MAADVKEHLEHEDAVRRGVIAPDKHSKSLKRDKDFETHDQDVRLLAEFALATGQTPDETRQAAWRVLGEVDDATESDVIRAQGVVDAQRITKDLKEAEAKHAEQVAKEYEEDREKFAKGDTPVTPEEAARMRAAKVARTEAKK
jgi:hypothetical protein